MTAPIPAGSLRPVRTTTRPLAPPSGPVDVTFDDHDRTRPFLLLHGGGGPATMAGFATLLAERTHSRVLAPTHPGFAGTPRPQSLATTKDLAVMYGMLLDDLDLSDVTVLGNSFGGWVALELALLGSPRVSGVVVVDGIGIEVDGHPLTDVSGLSPRELQQLSFHDPAKAPPPPTEAGPGPGPDVAALVAYTGPTMRDPDLLDRIRRLELPVHVLWGASDGIVDPEYGRALAAALPLATFTLLPASGHLPQVESPEELLGALLDLGQA